ncbi:hypothetical protein LTR04_002419 [Oleoguttula sp. CCFEE 6159]|nr:hypothetical protein LTR04_002419 [Oleoguttula sp. CCFEE 6159]
MLNEAMDQVVLVKGWKKGANWSFPRGKINKDEKDLDCAIREVYEETGYDIQEAGLVPAEDNVKYIDIPMREQHMRLYVFRGVPMETHFEPRTRKEISKIQWYKLSDLPTLKKSKQQPEGYGEDAVKANKFYMVAPFLGHLKRWIAEQRRLDNAKGVQHKRTLSQAPETTDAEEALEPEDEVAQESEIEPAPPGEMDRLLARLRSSQEVSQPRSFPEVVNAQKHVHDPAAELKRMLRVGASSSATPVSSGSEAASSDTLLAILRNSSGPSLRPSGYNGIPPRTPMDQITQNPLEPRSPTHHHRPRAPTLMHQSPPPAFSFSPPHFAHQQHGQSAQRSQMHANGLPVNARNQPRGFQPSPPAFHQQIPRNFQQPQFPATPMHPPGPDQPNQHAPRPYQRTGDPQFAQASQFPGFHAPAIPPASSLPPPKLTPHAMNLLNAFKGASKPSLRQDMNPIRSPPLSTANGVSAKVEVPKPAQPNLTPYSPPPAPNRALPITNVISPGQAEVSGSAPGSVPAVHLSSPKPRNAHQDNLLNLFRSPSAAQPPRPVLANSSATLAPEPVELSAIPSPAHSRQASFISTQPSAKKSDSTTNTTGQTLPSQRSQAAGSTAATITGPLNLPEFGTVRKHTKPVIAQETPPGAQEKPKTSEAPHVTILQRPQSKRGSPARPEQQPTAKSATPTSGSDVPFRPQILRRPDQGKAAPDATTAPSIRQGFDRFDRRESLPTEQKSALLNLFTKAAPDKDAEVSPVLSASDKPSQWKAPVAVDVTARSRLNSIALLRGDAVDGARVSSGRQTPVTPVEHKSFLLGFLDGVVKGEQGRGARR